MFQVENFVYNSFSVQSKPGIANYTATFKEWTNDPGIMVCNCSDGKKRLIPSCCLINATENSFPKQDLSNKVYFGQPSKS